MKKMTSALALIVSLTAMGSAYAAQDCSAKRSALESEIRIAQQFGNPAKVAGLRQALAEVNAHCTSASVRADVQKDVRKLEKKVADKQDDIREVQEDLRKAQAKGDREKVAKYQSKMREKQADLREAQQKLNQARAELASL
jgi:glutamine synthetase type III